MNDFQVISDKPETPKKDNIIAMTSQDDINLQPKPAPKLVFEKAGQNFSLIAPEVFEFGPPVEKNPKIDRSKINEQIDDLNDFKNKNDLKKYMA